MAVVQQSYTATEPHLTQSAMLVSILPYRFVKYGKSTAADIYITGHHMARGVSGRNVRNWATLDSIEDRQGFEMGRLSHFLGFRVSHHHVVRISFVAPGLSHTWLAQH